MVADHSWCWVGAEINDYRFLQKLFCQMAAIHSVVVIRCGTFGLSVSYYV